MTVEPPIGPKTPLTQWDSHPVPPPPLPPVLADSRPAVFAGSATFVAAVPVVALAGGSDTWVHACVAGASLGLLGFGVMTWQRSAARRGSKGAQRGLT